MININYIDTAGKLIAERTREYVPRVGDEVTFKEMTARVERVIWKEVADQRVNISVKAFNKSTGRY